MCALRARTEPLRQPVRPALVLKYTAQLALVLAGLLAVPLAVSALTRDLDVAVRLLAVAAVLLALAHRFARLPAPETLQANEALTIVTLTFVGSALATSFPLMAGGVPFADALFEAVSGVTTTGLSTLGGVESRSPSYLFTRARLQWIGGLEIVVMSIALVHGHGAAARRLLEPIGDDSPLTGARVHARRVVLVYCGLTAFGAAVLWAVLGSGDARVFSFVAHAEDEGAVRDLGLPEESRVLFLYRGGAFRLADDDTELEAEVVVVTHARNVPALASRWGTPRPRAPDPDQSSGPSR
jgi:trk system potassium uptake protein TrkH